MRLHIIFPDRGRDDLTSKIDPRIIGLEQVDQSVVIKDVYSHRRQEWPALGFGGCQAKAGGVDAHRFQVVAFRFFLELDDRAIGLGLQQPEFACFVRTGRE